MGVLVSMINQDLCQEQEQRELQVLEAIKIEANSNRDLQVLGLEDGIESEPVPKQYGRSSSRSRRLGDRARPTR